MQPAALVTGGAKRLGRAIALALAREGWDLAVHYNRSADAAEKLAAEIGDLGRRCETFHCELSDAAAVERMAEQVHRAFGGWNVLVNNASLFERGTLAETDEALFDRLTAVNLKAPLFLSKAFAARCGRGQIVNLLDTKVDEDLTSHLVYVVTKKALREVTRLAAKELAPDIRVNGVCPGLILPPPGEDEGYLERLARRVPLKRHGGAEDIVSAVLYLLRSEYVTGQCLFIDGGEHLR
jgi:NAD(P)-dependent dehydrogenase (short-subunit alcohol dehydrogenase family)